MDGPGALSIGSLSPSHVSPSSWTLPSNSVLHLPQISYRGQMRTLGSYDSSVEAACAHDEMAIRLQRKREELNFVHFETDVATFGYGLLSCQGRRSGGKSAMADLQAILATQSQLMQEHNKVRRRSPASTSGEAEGG